MSSEPTDRTPARADAHLGQRAMVSELVAALMKGPRTRTEIMEMTGMSDVTAVAWLREFEASGLVHGVNAGPDGRPGRMPVTYHWNSSPFAHVDGPGPVGSARRAAAQVTDGSLPL